MQALDEAVLPLLRDRGQWRAPMQEEGGGGGGGVVVSLPFVPRVASPAGFFLGVAGRGAARVLAGEALVPPTLCKSLCGAQRVAGEARLAARALSWCVAAYSSHARPDRALACLDALPWFHAWPTARAMWNLVRGLVHQRMDVDLAVDLSEKYAVLECAAAQAWHAARRSGRAAHVPAGLEHVVDEDSGTLSGVFGGAGAHHGSLLSILLRGCTHDRNVAGAELLYSAARHWELPLDLHDLTTMLDARARFCDADGAFAIVREMHARGFAPDVVVWGIVLRLCERTKALDLASNVWLQMRQSVNPDMQTYITYMRCAAAVGDNRRVREIYYEFRDAHDKGLVAHEPRAEDFVKEFMEAGYSHSRDGSLLADFANEDPHFSWPGDQRLLA